MQISDHVQHDIKSIQLLRSANFPGFTVPNQYPDEAMMAAFQTPAKSLSHVSLYHSTLHTQSQDSGQQC
jgi:hypothetical protein